MSKKRSGLASRLVDEVQMAPADIQLHPLNAKRHPRPQKDAMRQLLARVGWVEGVMVNQRTGLLVDGEMRAVLAQVLNEESLPVSLVDLSEEEEVLLLAALDASTALALPDQEKLSALHDSLSLDGPLAELAIRAGALPEILADAPDLPDEEPTWADVMEEEIEDTPDVTLIFGLHYRVAVDKDAYFRWRSRLQEEMDFSFKGARNEIVRRLGLEAMT